MLTVVDHHPNYGGEKKQTFESTNHCLMLCHYFTLRHFSCTIHVDISRWSPWSMEECTRHSHTLTTRKPIGRFACAPWKETVLKPKMRVSHFWSQKISLLDVAILDGLDDLLHPYLRGYPLKTIGNLQTFVQQPRLSRLRLEHVHTWNTCIPPTCNGEKPYGYLWILHKKKVYICIYSTIPPKK